MTSNTTLNCLHFYYTTGDTFFLDLAFNMPIRMQDVFSGFESECEAIAELPKMAPKASAIDAILQYSLSFH